MTFTEAIPEGASFEEISNPNLFFKKKADQNTFDTVMKYVNWRDVNYIELNWDIEDINNMDTLNEYAKDIDN